LNRVKAGDDSLGHGLVMPVVGTPSCRRRKRGHDERHDVAAGAGPAAALLCHRSVMGRRWRLSRQRRRSKAGGTKTLDWGGKRGGAIEGAAKKVLARFQIFESIFVKVLAPFSLSRPLLTQNFSIVNGPAAAQPAVFGESDSQRDGTILFRYYRYRLNERRYSKLVP